MMGRPVRRLLTKWDGVKQHGRPDKLISPGRVVLWTERFLDP